MAGSHGSLAKAGKVRNQTPKVDSRERHSPIPRVRNKKNYYKRVILEKDTTPGTRRSFRRR
ncbi:MAG: 30S ribosomal protein S30e [Candidatus Hodarchaeales archaeon]